MRYRDFLVAPETAKVTRIGQTLHILHSAMSSHCSSVGPTIRLAASLLVALAGGCLAQLWLCAISSNLDKRNRRPRHLCITFATGPSLSQTVRRRIPGKVRKAVDAVLRRRGIQVFDHAGTW